MNTISQVLATMDRQLLLVLKTNDLIRSIANYLGTDERRTFLTMTRCCLQAKQKLRLAECDGFFSRLAVRLQTQWLLFKISLFSLYLSFTKFSWNCSNCLHFCLYTFLSSWSIYFNLKMILVNKMSHVDVVVDDQGFGLRADPVRLKGLGTVSLRFRTIGRPVTRSGLNFTFEAKTSSREQVWWERNKRELETYF